MTTREPRVDERYGDSFQDIVLAGLGVGRLIPARGCGATLVTDAHTPEGKSEYRAA